ncbi:MAG TPA: RNA polymerase sigma factor [Rectinemataceae bacterium]|nr:RNA polymerase sigma factor [Rectinemataceae bacterium]
MSASQEATEGRARLEAAYRNDRGRLIAFALRMGRNLQEAEDVLQDVFASALARLDLVSALGNPSGYLAAAVRNRMLDLWRRSRTRRQAGEVDVAEETIDEIVGAVGLDPADEAVRGELSDALAEAIGDLPPEQRAVIEAQALGGMGFRELAERTGTSIDTLMARKRYAIEKLARALRDWIDEG